MTYREQRKSARLNHKLPCSVGSRNELEGGVVQNFSAEGMCIHTCLAAGRGDILEVIVVNGNGKKMTVRGSVARMRRNTSEDLYSYKHSVDLGLTLINAPCEYFQLLGSLQNETSGDHSHG